MRNLHEMQATTSKRASDRLQCNVWRIVLWIASRSIKKKYVQQVYLASEKCEAARYVGYLGLFGDLPVNTRA